MHAGAYRGALLDWTPSTASSLLPLIQVCITICYTYKNLALSLTYYKELEVKNYYREPVMNKVFGFCNSSQGRSVG